MGDYSYARIEIGGPLTQEQARDLVAAVTEGTCERMVHDTKPMMEVSFEPQTIEDLLKAVEEGERPYLTLYDYQATGGQFDGLEHALSGLGIPFDRQNDACLGCWDGGLVMYRPNMNPPFFETWTVGDYEVGVSASEIQEILAASAAVMVGGDPADAYEELVLRLRRRLGENVPPLQPFTIEGYPAPVIPPPLPPV